MFFPEHKDKSEGLINHNNRFRRKSMIISMEAEKILDKIQHSFMIKNLSKMRK